MTATETIVRSAIKRAKGKAKRELRLVNPEDAGQAFLCRVPANGIPLDRMQKAAEARKRAVNVHFCRAVLGYCVESIEEAGVVLEIDGRPTNFRDRALHDLLNQVLTDEGPVGDEGDPEASVSRVATAADAAYVYLGSDGVVVALANQLLEEAGWKGDGVTVEDPTSHS